jgi:hypothetical protein
MKPQDELWWAFLDGGMSPAEAAKFDQALTPEDRERMTGDLNLETELAEVLGAPVSCPKDAWKTALRLVRAQKRTARPPRGAWSRRLLKASLPLAAVLAISLAVYFGREPQPQPLFLTLGERDASALAADSQVSEGVQGVRAFMTERALPVELDPAGSFDGENAQYRLLGAREDKFSGELIIQLLFDCDGEPAKVVITRKAGRAAAEIGKALAAGTIRASRSIDGVVIAVVGAGAPRDLIHVLGDDWPVPAPNADQVPDQMAEDQGAPIQESDQEAPQPTGPEPQPEAAPVPPGEEEVPSVPEPTIPLRPDIPESVVSTLV